MINIIKKTYNRVVTNETAKTIIEPILLAIALGIFIYFIAYVFAVVMGLIMFLNIPRNRRTRFKNGIRKQI